jgi:hypothetical protein
MAKQMKTVRARKDESVLVVKVDLLAVARGCRKTRRGGVHQTARKPSRARAKRQWRLEAADRSGSRRSRGG